MLLPRCSSLIQLGPWAHILWGPSVVPRGLWHRHVKAMPTVLWRRAVVKFCLLGLFTCTESPRQSPWMDSLPGCDKPISLIPSFPRCFWAVLHITEALRPGRNINIKYKYRHYNQSHLFFSLDYKSFLLILHYTTRTSLLQPLLGLSLQHPDKYEHLS